MLEGSVAAARRAEAEADKFQLALAWAETHRAIPIGGDHFVLNTVAADGIAHEVDVRDRTRLGVSRYWLHRYAIEEFAISLQVSSQARGIDQRVDRRRGRTSRHCARASPGSSSDGSAD